MEITDPVVWGSIASVGIAVVIFVFLLFKIKALMKRDAQGHQKQQ